jgi:F-box and WD-40 domain protein 1/11
VLRDLDHRALAQASLVNKQWHRLCNESSIWRDAFYRDKTVAAAIGHPIVPGSGLGIPAPTAEKDFKKLYQAKNDLDRNWREGDARAVYLNGHTDSVYCVQFDEHKIITGSRDKTIRIWDMHTYACKLIIAPPHVANLPNLIKSDKDGSLLHHATIHNDSETPTDVSFSKPRVESFAIFHDASILCLQYDQDILVTGSSDGTCIIYDIAQGYRPIRQLTHHTAAVLDLSFDDKHIVTCSKDATICIWNRQTGKLMRQLTGHGGPVNAVQLRGNLIVSCSGDFSVKLWNLDTGKNIREFSGHTKGLACSVLSADSRYIASAGNDRVIRVWDAMSGECLQKIEAHTNLVRSLHIDSVSGRLISGSYDQDIKVFDLLTGQLLLDFPQWHSSWVLGAKSDYRRIVSTGQDRKILIMDFGGDVKGVEELMSAPQETSLARVQRLQYLKEKAAIEAAEDEARQQVQGWTLLGGTERP